MDDSQSSIAAAAGQSILDHLAQQAAALDGYPVHELMEVFLMSAEQRDRAQAHRLVERCIVHWIHALEGALNAYPPAPDEALLKIQLRQIKARDALFTLRGALSRLDMVQRDPRQLN